MKYIACIILALWVFTACKKEEETKPVTQDIKELVFASGQIEWEEAYELVAQSEGILSNFDSKIGQDIEKNQILARMDNSAIIENLQSSGRNLDLIKQNIEPQIAEIEEDIRFAEQKYQQEKTQSERFERLYAKQSVSKNDYENAQINLENASNQLNVLKQKLKSIKIQNQQAVVLAQNQKNTNAILESYSYLKAPLKGKIMSKNKVNGDFIKKGDVVALIADERKFEAVLNVDENSISKVSVGQKVFIRLNTNRDLLLNGIVTSINAAFDTESQSFIVKASLDSIDFTPLNGAQLEANILVNEKKNVLLLPRSVVGAGNKVRVKGHKEEVVIKTGIVSNDYLEVLSGINKDDIILPLKP